MFPIIGVEEGELTVGSFCFLAFELSFGDPGDLGGEVGLLGCFAVFLVLASLPFLPLPLPSLPALSPLATEGPLSASNFTCSNHMESLQDCGLRFLHDCQMQGHHFGHHIRFAVLVNSLLMPQTESFQNKTCCLHTQVRDALMAIDAAHKASMQKIAL